MTIVDTHRRSLATVKVNGRPLAAATMDSLSEVRVEQSLHVPDAFTLRFNDHDGGLLGSFPLGAMVEIGVDCGGVTKRLIKGEVTGLSADLDGLTQQQLVVTGLDRRHRLTRGVKVCAYAKMSDSDVVKRIAQAHGLAVRADPSRPVYDYLLQCASDFDFVSERARACGFDWWLDGDVLHFRRPGAAQRAATVTWGQTLRRFRLRLSSAESASQAVVRGWDHQTQQAVIGEATLNSDARLATTAPLARRAAGASSTFPAVRLAWGAPVQSQPEGKAMAEAMATGLGAEQAVARGEALGDPALRPGVTVTVAGLARSLCGDYRLSRVEHVLRAGEVYVTRFESGGSGDHTLVDLLGGGAGGRRGAAPGPAAPPLGSSLVVAVVTNKRDPAGLGRVKVKFVGLADTVESAWARVVSVGAGTSRGLHVVPDVNDEVLVGFEYGDLRRPLVLGGLWSGRQANPRHVTSGAQDGAVWRTRSGHILSMSDGGGPESYARLALASGRTALRLGADASSLQTERDLTVDSAAAVTVKGRTDVTVEALNVTVKAGMRLVLEGQMVEIKANGPLKVNGAVIDVAAQGAASLGGGGVTQIKGAAVKIN